MLKQLIQLFWYENEQPDGEHRTFRKNFARLKKHGLSGMMERMKKDYKSIEKDYITRSILDARYKKFIAKVVFLLFLFISLFYVLCIKSELYESKSSLIVKDMQTGTTTDTLGLSLLGIGSSSQLQDSKIVEAYLQSPDLYQVLDYQFNLTRYYKSDALDFISVLPIDATFEEVLEYHNKHLNVIYDEVSGILKVSFSHTESLKAQDILKFIVKKVEEKLNELNKLQAIKKLNFVRKEFEKAKQKMEKSSKKLEEYQNEHLLLDPNAEATTASTMIAELEASRLQKEIEYSTLSSYLKEDNYELITLRKEIEEIEESIVKERKILAGTSGDRLNKVLFEYEKLKLQLEFDTEVYKTALIQLETTKIDVIKEAKTLSILSKPNLPDGYTYPNKQKMFITILFVTFLMYGIFMMLSAIIRDHKE